MSVKGEANRTRIVDAANDLFYRQGFTNTSFADIARSAGVPKGNFYFYFPTKNDLLAAVIDGRLERFRALLDSWEQAIADPGDRLKRLAEMPYRDFTRITEYGCPMGSLTVELGKQDHDMCGHAQKVFSLLLDWAERQFGLRCGKGADAAALARHLVVRLQGASLMAQACHDESWITDEVARTKEWIDGL